MKKLIFSFLLVSLLFNINGFAISLSTATIENGGSHKYKAVRLTPEIYNNTKANLSDILLVDKENQPVPYFINYYTEKTQTLKDGYVMSLQNSFVKYEYFYADYGVSPKYNKDVLATSIEVTTKNSSFAKNVELLGGYDNLNWEMVKNDTLYNVNGNKKLSILFDKPEKYTYYRFKIPNNLEKISFDSVKLDYSDTVKEKTYFVEKISPKFSVEQKDKTTVISITGLKNLKISDVGIETDTMFKRTVSYAHGRSKTLYNLQLNKTVYQDMVLPFDGFKVQEDVLTITIDNKDDKPITVSSISVNYFVDELIFEGKKDEQYTMTFNNYDVTTAPTYDIANYKELILKEGYDELKIKDVKTEPPKPEPKQYDYKFIFNIIVTIIAVLLGIVILLKLKKKSD